MVDEASKTTARDRVVSGLDYAEKGGPMFGVWLKKCPRCGNYMMKTDPQETCMCCACGWQENNGHFFCEVINDYCDHCDLEPKK